MAVSTIVSLVGGYTGLVPRLVSASDDPSLTLDSDVYSPTGQEEDYSRATRGLDKGLSASSGGQQATCFVHHLLILALPL